jgi:hypothetical protein
MSSPQTVHSTLGNFSVSGGEFIPSTTKPADGLLMQKPWLAAHDVLFFSSVLAESKRKSAAETRRGKDIHN